MKKLSILVFATLLCTACLERQTTQTLYLAPDGSVTWEILETGVRSSEQDRDTARREEADYLSAAAASNHDLARGLARLGSRPGTAVLRDVSPFTVHTRARFPSGPALADVLQAELTGAVDIVLSREGARARAEIHVNPEFDWESLDGSPLLALLTDTEDFRIVLTEGRFIEATGFAIVDPYTAILKPHGDGAEFALVWTTEPVAHASRPAPRRPQPHPREDADRR